MDEDKKIKKHKNDHTIKSENIIDVSALNINNGYDNEGFVNSEQQNLNKKKNDNKLISKKYNNKVKTNF